MFKRGSPVYEDKPDITPFQSTAEKRPRTEDEKAALINKQIKETEIMATHLRQQGLIKAKGVIFLTSQAANENVRRRENCAGRKAGTKFAESQRYSR